MDHISQLLPKVLKKRGLYDQVEASLIVFHAQEWINKEFPEMQNEITAKIFKDNHLIIESLHSAASQECHLRHEDLRTYLRDDCGHTCVEHIRTTRTRKA